jgi:hypothetical protein
MHDSAIILGINTIDLATLYKVDLMLSNPSNIKITMDPTQILFITCGREMLAVGLIERECEYLYIDLG